MGKSVSELPPPEVSLPLKTSHPDNAGLLDYFRNTWELYEWLFTSISEDSTYFIAPDPLRHPLIFYYGHTAVFYINKLVMAGLMTESQRINPRFEVLFAKGVDPDSPDNLEKGIAWPSVDEVREYRKTAFNLLRDFILGADLPAQFDDSSPYWGFMMGLEHDRIHFETSSVLIRQYDAGLLSRPQGWIYAPTEAAIPQREWVALPGGVARLGKPESFPTFGWDNEYGHLEVAVPPFKVSNLLITNAEFLEFVEAGGYQKRAFWTEESWAWLQENEIQEPKFWRKSTDGWEYRAMFDWLPLPATWPAEVNFHEADAYIRWRNDGSRFMSEAEFHLMIQGAVGTEKGNDVVWEQNLHNLNVAYGSPSPVGFFTAGKTPDGVYDPVGNVWQWLSDLWYPLPGFETHPYYEDFSAPYFDDEHNMMLGGAWASSGTSASRFYRLWFRRHFYQHAGFRLAKSV